MKITAILMVGILSIMPSIAQEAFEPHWICLPNIGFSGEIGTEGYTCAPVCTEAEDGIIPLSERRNLRNACAGPLYDTTNADDAFRCAADQGDPICSISSSGGGGTSNADRALITGGVAIAVVAAYNFLYPETPEGVNVRPVANLAYRDGLAVSIAGLKGEWRNLEFSAMSANAGEGWTKPYTRVQWTWAF